MKVGVYVDGFNLYFGAREQCGAGTAGWRWLDVRSLVADALPSAWRKDGAAIERVVYCTARVSGIDDPSTPRDQNVYLRALRAGGSVDHIEFGKRRHASAARRSRWRCGRCRRSVQRQRPGAAAALRSRPGAGGAHQSERQSAGRQAEGQAVGWRGRSLVGEPHGKRVCGPPASRPGWQAAQAPRLVAGSFRRHAWSALYFRSPTRPLRGPGFF